MMVPSCSWCCRCSVFFALFPGFYGLTLTAIESQSARPARPCHVFLRMERIMTRCYARLMLVCPSGRDDGDDRERGDVPGWVLITVMTAGLVTALWLVAEPQLNAFFQSALNAVHGP